MLTCFVSRDWHENLDLFFVPSVVGLDKLGKVHTLDVVGAMEMISCLHPLRRNYASERT